MTVDKGEDMTTTDMTNEVERTEPSNLGRRWTAVIGLSLATAAMMLAVVIGGPLITTPLYYLAGNDVAVVAAGLACCVLAIGLVWLWHRRRGPALWSNLGLTLDRRTPMQCAAGVAVAAVLAAVTAVVAVLAGAGTWHTTEQMGVWLAGVPLSFIVAFLLQSFPEELLFRGHLQERLARWLPTAGVLALSTLWFGALHLVSGGPENALQQGYLMVQATAFAFACAAARHRSGTIWMAVGLHGGFHLWRGLLVPQETVYTLPGVLSAVVGYAMVGLILLRIPRRRRRARPTAATVAGDER